MNRYFGALEVITLVSMEVLGERVRIAMARQKLSQLQLCHKAGMGSELVNRIYNGKARTSMSLGTLEKLAKALGVPVESLIMESPRDRDAAGVVQWSSADSCYNPAPKPPPAHTALKSTQAGLFHDVNGLQAFDAARARKAPGSRLGSIQAASRRAP